MNGVKRSSWVALTVNCKPCGKFILFMFRFLLETSGLVAMVFWRKNWKNMQYFFTCTPQISLIKLK